MPPVCQTGSVGPSGKRLHPERGGGGEDGAGERGGKLSGEETLSDQSVASWSYVPLIRRHGLQSAIAPFHFTPFAVLRSPRVRHRLPPQ